MTLYIDAMFSTSKYVWNIELCWSYVSHFIAFAALESQNSIPWSSFQATGNIITSWGSWSPSLRDPGDSAARPPPWTGICSAARWASSASSRCRRSASFVSSPPQPLSWKAAMLRWSKCKLTLTSRCQTSPSRRWSCWCSPWWRSRRSTCTLCWPETHRANQWRKPREHWILALIWVFELFSLIEYFWDSFDTLIICTIYFSNNWF